MTGKKPLGIMIAVGKPGPPPPKFRVGGDEPPSKAEPEPDQDDRNRPQVGGYQVGPEDVEYKSGDLCGSCAHMGNDGNCMKYGFPVDEQGHCEAGYEPKHQQMGGNESPEGEY